MQTNAPVHLWWWSIASSADGSKLVAVAENQSAGYRGPIYTSSDSGGTWVLTSAPSNVWVSVASSADGTKLAAVNVIPGGIYTSTNSGTTWISNNVPQLFWYSIASSADGTKLAAAAQSSGHAIYTSINSGLNWMQQSNAPSNATWTSVALSADGIKLVAVSGGVGRIYTSTNSGLTWLTNNVSGDWNSVASSADGGNLVAETQSNPGGIYFSQSMFTPQLNITFANTNLMLSWIIPSTNFVVQQNLDLTSANWKDISNKPILNFTNLQNQVVLLPTNSSDFFRLISQ